MAHPPKRGKRPKRGGSLVPKLSGGRKREQQFRRKEAAALVIWHEILTSGLLVSTLLVCLTTKHSSPIPDRVFGPTLPLSLACERARGPSPIKAKPPFCSFFGKKGPKMAKNGPGRNGTPPKTGKTTQKRGEFGPQTLAGAEKGAKILAKGSRCARHLARIFDQRPPRYIFSWRCQSIC
jgi:hypothetical protein